MNDLNDAPIAVSMWCRSHLLDKLVPLLKPQTVRKDITTRSYAIQLRLGTLHGGVDLWKRCLSRRSRIHSISYLLSYSMPKRVFIHQWNKFRSNS